MKHKIGQVMSQHIEEHSSLYIFSTVLFLMGIIFGTLTVQSLGYNQQADLFYYFEQFMKEAKKGPFVDPSYSFYQNFIHYLKYVGIIWVLGLSIIGLPVILILLFLKGVFVGFTVGFLIHQLGWEGFVFAFVSVIPQNMIVVPLILVMSVISITFSLKLIGYLFGSNRIQQKPHIPKYVGTIIAAAIILVVVSAFQTYVSPTMMEMVSYFE